MARLIRRIENFVVENGEIQGETKADWVGGSKVSLSNFGGILVGLEGFVGRSLTLVTKGEFSQIAVVIPLPKRNNPLTTTDKAPKSGELTSCGRRP